MKKLIITALIFCFSLAAKSQVDSVAPFSSDPDVSGIYMAGRIGGGTGFFAGTSLNVRVPSGFHASLAAHFNARTPRHLPAGYKPSVFDPSDHLTTWSFTLGKDYRLRKKLVAGYSAGGGISLYRWVEYTAPQDASWGLSRPTRSYKDVYPALSFRGKLQFPRRLAGFELGLTADLTPITSYVGIDIGLLLGLVDP